jgi:hypothetical protein
VRAPPRCWCCRWRKCWPSPRTHHHENSRLEQPVRGAKTRSPEPPRAKRLGASCRRSTRHHRARAQRGRCRAAVAHRAIRPGASRLSAGHGGGIRRCRARLASRSACGDRAGHRQHPPLPRRASGDAATSGNIAGRRVRALQRADPRRRPVRAGGFRAAALHRRDAGRASRPRAVSREGHVHAA